MGYDPKKKEIMEKEGIYNPYSEERLPKGSKVKCKKSVNGVTFCTVERKTHKWNICIASLIFLLIILIFSLRVNISFN